MMEDTPSSSYNCRAFIYERRDRFPFFGHQLLHAVVADHEVGGGRILIDEQGAGAASRASITLAAWEVLPLAFGGKTEGCHGGEIVDERADVYLFHKRARPPPGS